MASTLLRLLSLQALKAVRESDEVPVGQLIRVLRNVRGLNTTNGLHALLHPFVEAPAEKERNGSRESWFFYPAVTQSRRVALRAGFYMFFACRRSVKNPQGCQ